MTDCPVVIFWVKMSSIMSLDGIILWLLTWLVNYVVMLLAVCQLSRNVIGYEDSSNYFWLLGLNLLQLYLAACENSTINTSKDSASELLSMRGDSLKG